MTEMDQMVFCPAWARSAALGSAAQVSEKIDEEIRSKAAIVLLIKVLSRKIYPA